MPLLTVNYSDALEQLYSERCDIFDGLEIGPWFSYNQIPHLKETFPQKPVYFHRGNFLFPQRKLESVFDQVTQYLSATNSPWLSCHIELLPGLTFHLGQHARIYLPPPKSEKSILRFLEVLETLKTVANMPILLENLHSLRGKRYEYAANPETLSSIITQSESSLLLDLAHAIVAAELQNQELHNYIERFPLDRIKQVHVSGVRVKNGRLYDAHESMRDEDYSLLEWLLTICEPEVVTLEYFKQKDALFEQLKILKNLVAD